MGPGAAWEAAGAGAGRGRGGLCGGAVSVPCRRARGRARRQGRRCGKQPEPADAVWARGRWPAQGRRGRRLSAAVPRGGRRMHRGAGGAHRRRRALGRHRGPRTHGQRHLQQHRCRRAV